MKRMSIILVLLIMAFNAYAIEPANNRESKSIIEQANNIESKSILELLDDDKEEFDWVKIPTFEELYKLPESDVITEQDERILDKTRTVVERFLDSVLKIFEDDNQK